MHDLNPKTLNPEIPLRRKFSLPGAVPGDPGERDCAPQHGAGMDGGRLGAGSRPPEAALQLRLRPRALPGARNLLSGMITSSMFGCLQPTMWKRSDQHHPALFLRV